MMSNATLKKFKLNTVDLDFNDKEKVGRIIQKIRRCPFLLAGWIRESSSGNGYHIKLYCSIKCDLCRMVFDDSFRYYADQYRPEYRQNILWNYKEYSKAGKKIGLKTGEWIRFK